MSKMILIDEATVKQALDVLEKSRPINQNSVLPHNKHVAAVAALREALAREAKEHPAKDEFKAAYIEAMVASNEAGFSGMSAAETIRELSRMVAEQPAQPSKPWVPVTQELLHEQHPWLYEPMWIAMKDGSVIQGHYEWRQGWNPDRFIAEGFNHWAFDAAYVMPVIKPTPPAIEATIGITGEQK